MRRRDALFVIMTCLLCAWMVFLVSVSAKARQKPAERSSVRLSFEEPKTSVTMQASQVPSGVACYTHVRQTIYQIVEPNTVQVDLATNLVTITFSSPQTGFCILQ